MNCLIKRRWLIPSLIDAFFVTFLFLTLLSFGDVLLRDKDTGVHVRFGEFLVQTSRIPQSDVFSFITPTPVRISHDWLSEAAVFWVHQHWGLAGIVLLSCLVISGFYTLLFAFLKRHSNFAVSLFLVLMVFGCSAFHLLARPYLVSSLFALLFYVVLFRFQQDIGFKRQVYFLPFLMMFWVNLHAGFSIGFVLLIIYTLANSIYTAADPSRFHQERVKVLILTLAACLLVSGINPRGFEILSFPFQAAFNGTILKHIGEYLPPNFREMFSFELFLFLTIFVLAFSRISLNLIETLLILVFAHLALTSVRHIPLFAAISAPILAARLDKEILPRIGRWGVLLKNWDQRILKIEQSTAPCLWGVFAVTLAVLLISQNKLHFDFTGRKIPPAAVEFLKNNKIPGNVYNADEFGDHMIYALWPRYPVFVHGLSDYVSETQGRPNLEIFKNYLEVAHLKPGWKEALKKYNINWIFYYADAPLSVLLLSQADWRLIYADEVANIFVRNTPENQELIRKFPNVRPVYAGEDAGLLSDP